MSATTTLVEQWSALPAPTSDEAWAFSTIGLERHPQLRLGRGAAGPALLLARAAAAPAAPAIHLANLDALFGVECVIESGGSARTEVMDVVVCTSADAGLRTLFLQAAERLIAPFQSGVEVAHLIVDLVELFRAVRRSPKGSIVGVWGELFLIDRAPSVDVLLDAWHSDPTETFDFAREDRRLESKVSLGERAHHFSLEQVSPIEDIVGHVASILTKSAVSGPSILDLVGRIAERSSDQAAATRLMHGVTSALGSDAIHVAEARFDDVLAAASLRIYPCEAIPRPAEVPDTVSSVKFVSKLEEVAHTDVEPWAVLRPDPAIRARKAQGRELPMTQTHHHPGQNP